MQMAVPFILMLMCFTCMKIGMKSRHSPLNLDIGSVYGSTDGFYYKADTPANRPLLSLARTFEKVLASNNARVAKVSKPTQYVLDYGSRDLTMYLKRLVVGGAFDYLDTGTLNLTAWYNSRSYHSMPMSVLLMQTALLRHVSGMGKISLELEPVVPVMRRNQDNAFFRSGASEWSRVFVPMIFAFLSLSFVVGPAGERASGAKSLQLMSGVPAAVYWMAAFLWDGFIYCVTCGLLIAVPAMFFPGIFAGTHPEAIGTLIVLLFLYGWASLPLGYIVSILMKRENHGLVIFIGFCILLSFLSVFMLDKIEPYTLLKYDEKSPAIEATHWLLRLFPLYSISRATRANFVIAFYNAVCDIFTPNELLHCSLASRIDSPTLFFCCKAVCKLHFGTNYYDCYETLNHLSLKKQGFHKGNGIEALFLGVEGIVFFAILLLLETRTATKFANIVSGHSQRIWDRMARAVLRKQHRVLHKTVTVDPQVLQEEERVRNSTSTQGRGALAVLGLARRSGTPHTRLTFGVDAGECLGILGVGGTGKTSVFRTLTGKDVPSEGNACIQSDSLMGNFVRFRSHIGYCPEVDPLLDDLTGRETLLLFGQLRGLRGCELQKRVKELIQSLGLLHCADQLAQFYGGGDRRKLSVALALVGSPPVILLDEPTARVGPESRLQIWKVLEQARKKTGAAVLLATQSVDECKFLCKRLAIMENGQFRRLGSMNQLKSRQGQECALPIELGKDDKQNLERANALKNDIQSSLKNAALPTDYQGIPQLQTVDPAVTDGQLFKFMSDDVEESTVL